MKGKKLHNTIKHHSRDSCRHRGQHKLVCRSFCTASRPSPRIRLEQRQDHVHQKVLELDLQDVGLQQALLNVDLQPL